MKIVITIEDKAILNKAGKETGADVSIETDPPIDLASKKHAKSTAIKMLGVFLERLDSVMGVDTANLETGGNKYVRQKKHKAKNLKHRRKVQ